MRYHLILAAIYVPAFIAGRVASEYTGHAFLLGWVVGIAAYILAQCVPRADGQSARKEG